MPRYAQLPPRPDGVRPPVRPAGKRGTAAFMLLLSGLILFGGATSVRAAGGTLDTSFNSSVGANQEVYAAAMQPDGKLIIGGQFTTYNGTPRSHIARLNTDGSLDTSFNTETGASSAVFTIAVQPDGKIVIGGTFTFYKGTPRTRVARLNSDGSLDTSFDPGTGADSNVFAAVLQSDNKIVIGGFFSNYNNTPRGRIARLNTDGSLDTSFASGAGADNGVTTVALAPDGKFAIGGFFSQYNGASRVRVARLNSDGTLDASFDPGAGPNNGVYALAFRPSGKLIVGGSFTAYNGTTRRGIVRANSDGTLDTSFDMGSGASDTVATITPQADGKLIIGGSFTAYNGTSRARVARLESDGALDTSFDPGAGANDTVSASALQPDGRILIAGSFSQYNNTPRGRVARLLAAPVPTQPAAAGQVIISEFRLSGPGGTADEYVEFYNTTDSPLSIAGYMLTWINAAGDSGSTVTLPAGAVVPARSHYLVAGSGYTLASRAAADHSFGAIMFNSGVGLFTDFTRGPSARIDSIAFSDLNPSSSFYILMAEGTPLPQTGDSTEQHAWVRRLTTGAPQDTNNNAADFMLVSTSGTSVNGVQPVLGAPGPENLSSPLNRTGQMPTSPIAPCVALTLAPNRVRDTTPGPAATSSLGTLDIRRRFTNATGAAVTRLRFRIVDITTLPAPSGTADLRAITSADVVVSNPCTGTTQTVRGTTLEEPPTQPNGGGFNSTLAVGIVTLAAPLANGANIDVRFLLGVQQTGQFRFFVAVEPLP